MKSAFSFEGIVAALKRATRLNRQQRRRIGLRGSFTHQLQVPEVRSMMSANTVGILMSQMAPSAADSGGSDQDVSAADLDGETPEDPVDEPPANDDPVSDDPPGDVPDDDPVVEDPVEVTPVIASQQRVSIAGFVTQNEAFDLGGGGRADQLDRYLTGAENYTLSENGPSCVTLNGNNLEFNFESGNQTFDPDLGRDNPRIFTVTGTNQSGGEASVEFVLSIVNRRPKFELERVGPQTVVAGDVTEVQIELNPNDPDGDEVTTTVTSTMPEGGLKLEMQDGTLSLQGVASANQVGEHVVTVTCKDDFGGVATRPFTLTVKSPQAEFNQVKTDVKALDAELDETRNSIKAGEERVESAKERVKSSQQRLDQARRDSKAAVDKRAQLGRDQQAQAAANVPLKNDAEAKRADLKKAQEAEQVPRDKVNTQQPIAETAQREAETARAQANRAKAAYEKAPDKTAAQRREKERLKAAWLDADKIADSKEGNARVQNERLNALKNELRKAKSVTAQAAELSSKADSKLAAGEQRLSDINRRLGDVDNEIRKLKDLCAREVTALNQEIAALGSVQQSLVRTDETVRGIADRMAALGERLLALENNPLMRSATVRDYRRGEFSDVFARANRHQKAIAAVDTASPTAKAQALIVEWNALAATLP